ncbi:hypothetical protein [Isoptericola cucumis]|uniref:WXG100 family type VII secretion target n=1 Tax=Isoptericola cucumis TaxID=1776856 RepID=A0ABQ2BCX4_9MICO|nr:hypothetical protein [Isoptericola cucumis]GGI11423.1 hypothetical protein GCM10007368_36120 [Isoptericola cucumis]
MAGYDLSIDMEELRTLAKDLKTIQDEFEGADGRAEDAADATGHDELAGKVNDFADKWRIKREEMTGNVKKLQGIVQQIADTFTEVDTELAKALEDAAEKAK